jgi:hypothetical protein
MEVDGIFGYDKLVAVEKATLQKGMNYRVGKDYSVFLMSLRENAPYADALAETFSVYQLRIVSRLRSTNNSIQ